MGTRDGQERAESMEIVQGSEISPAAPAERFWGVTISHQKHRKPLQPSHSSDNGLGAKHPLLVAKCWENIARLFTQGLLLASQL